MDALRRSVLLACVIVMMSCLPAAVLGAERWGAPVSANPADFTPQVEADSTTGHPTVLALSQLGGTLYAGGSFHTVTDAEGVKGHRRHNLMAFSATTGQLLPFAPDVNGTVWSLATHRGAVYVGGAFSRVNGVARPGLVKLDAVTGEVLQRFAPRLGGGNVTEVRVVDGRVLVGGTFPGKLRALDPRTGADTGFIRLSITGRVAANSGPTKVYRFAVDPAGTQLVAVGNFTAVGGVARRQAFMLDLTGARASLARWYYRPLANKCRSDRVTSYLRDVDFSPNGRYFVVVASGFVPRPRGLGRDICDAAARFESAIAHPRRPTWINYTGGDTLHSVAVTGPAVYVQGHQRWLDNPLGRNSAGEGAVPRPGIGAIHPGRGTALEWNPGKTRGVGGKDLLATPAGLWVASDGSWFGGEYHSRIVFCPERG